VIAVLGFVVAHPTLKNTIVISSQRYRKKIWEVHRGSHHIMFINLYHNNIVQKSVPKACWFVGFGVVFLIAHTFTEQIC